MRLVGSAGRNKAIIVFCCIQLKQVGPAWRRGVIAASLSVRREFIGQPKVREIFVSTATDLKRERYFQSRGPVDLMRAGRTVWTVIFSGAIAYI
jgi:hypothetical protein